MHKFERDLFKGIPESLSTFDEETKEYWLQDLYYNYTSPLKNIQARHEIILQIARYTSREPESLEVMISHDLPNIDGLQKAWKLGELCLAWDALDNGNAAAHKYCKAYGCAEGKGNATEKAIKEWKRNGGYERQSVD